MSPPEVWGPAVWTLFHTLSERVREQAYPFIAKQLFAQIVSICKYLPCPDCSSDASIFLAKVNVSDLKTKTEFKNLFYLFHNYVNVKKRKPLFNYAKMNIYSNHMLIPVVNNFNAKYNTKGNMNLIAESFQRSLVQNNFKKWIVANIAAFVPPPQIQMQLANQPVVIEEPVVIKEPAVIKEPVFEESFVEKDSIGEEPIVPEEQVDQKSKNSKKNKK